MIKIKETETKAIITAPYNKKFISAVKRNFQGKWNGSEWEVNIEFLNEVRKLLKEVYGENDIEKAKMLTLELIALEDIKSDYNVGIEAFDKTLAIAIGRDDGAKTGEDVALMSGEIGSCGSRAYVNTTIDKGTKFKMVNVPEPIYERDLAKASELFEVTVAKKDNKARLAELMLQKEELTAKINEIDKLIKELEN